MPKAEMHGVVVMDGMAHRETSELGREGDEVGTKKCIRCESLESALQ